VARGRPGQLPSPSDTKPQWARYARLYRGSCGEASAWPNPRCQRARAEVCRAFQSTLPISILPSLLHSLSHTLSSAFFSLREALIRGEERACLPRSESDLPVVQREAPPREARERLRGERTRPPHRAQHTTGHTRAPAALAGSACARSDHRRPGRPSSPPAATFYQDCDPQIVTHESEGGRRGSFNVAHAVDGFGE